MTQLCGVFVRIFVLTILLLLAAAPKSVFAFSATGHHVIAVIAFELLSAEEQAELLRLLEANPRFADDFTPPESIAGSPEAVARWRVGVAGEWPDIIRSVRQFNRSTWHYQLGANLTIGGAVAPASPGPAPAEATLKTQDLYIGQAIELCRRVLNDRSRSDQDRAIALCWLCHLVADSHQPCHAGSLYSPTAFPEGDRGANSIRLTNGRNMHALWDGLLGRGPTPNDVRKRVFDIMNDPSLRLTGIYAADSPADLEPQTWLAESRSAAILYVYSPQVMQAIQAVERGLVEKLEALTMPEDYLQVAGSIAQVRASQAGYRLAAILKQGLGPQTSSQN